MNCDHEFVEYVGLTNKFNYCHLCGLKESINVTKTEFMDAVDKVYRRDDFTKSKFAELLWEEIEADWNGEPEDD